jgi:hypothetical protein
MPALRTAAVRCAAATALVIGLAACGGNSSPQPTGIAAAATPAPTQDLHITGNADPNRIFQILAAAGLPVHQESLGAGPSGEPVSVLFVREGFQALAIQQYSSPKALLEAGFKPGRKIGKGDSTYTFWAGNIVLNLGPRDDRIVPAAPTTELQADAARIVAVLDPFLGPLQQRSVVPITLPSTPVPATPPPTATPRSPVPSPTKH